MSKYRTQIHIYDLNIEYAFFSLEPTSSPALSINGSFFLPSLSNRPRSSRTTGLRGTLLKQEDNLRSSSDTHLSMFLESEDDNQPRLKTAVKYNII